MMKRSPVTARLASDKRAHVMREIVETLLFVGLVFLIVQFAIRPVRVVDSSMEPNLHPDQLLIVNRAAYLFSGPSRCCGVL
jgi:signal peptidase I